MTSADCGVSQSSSSSSTQTDQRLLTKSRVQLWTSCFPHLRSHVCQVINFRCLSVSDSKLEAAEVWTSRQALQDLYQKMLVTDLEYALDKKVEQDL